MAVMEKKPKNVILDDTQALNCTIEAAQNVQGHTEYIIKVQRGPDSKCSWQIIRRYSDFLALHTSLQISGVELPLPPKKMFGNLEREFIAERQQGLQNYLNSVLGNPLLSLSIHVKRFLDPYNYITNFQEQALQYVSMFFRSEPTWEIVEPLPEIGCRLRKQFFLAKNNFDAKQKYILCWCEFGPDKFLSNKDLLSVMKNLTSLKHPYIYPLVFGCANDIGGLAIRVLNPNGSLRDHICKAKFSNCYLKKYGRPKMYNTLQMNNIQTYGRQILEALKFLHDKGLWHGHLHTGNIILEDGVCKLSELENHILGLPSLYRPYFVHLRKVQSPEAVDVYSFGHVIFEMVFGCPLNHQNCDSFPPTCHPQIKSVMESILTTEAGKGGLPSVADLLTHPLFREVPLNSVDHSGWKLSSQLRESSREAKEKFEARLKEEQQVLRQIKRLSKAQTILTSEEEKKKRKQLKKKNQLQKNGKDDCRSDSPNSNASTCSAPTPPPAPPLPVPGSPLSPSSEIPPPPPPLLSPNYEAKPPLTMDRSQLLGSIQSFNKSGLRKATVNDRSKPIL